MNMKSFASDLYRKGELDKVKAMGKLANEIEKDTNSGLSGAYLTNGVYDKYDVVGMIANDQEHNNKTGYVFYDNENNQAVFVSDETLNNM